MIWGLGSEAASSAEEESLEDEVELDDEDELAAAGATFGDFFPAEVLVVALFFDSVD